MMRLPIIVKFDGREAERHAIPAYEAIESLRGVTLALTMILYYMQEGIVRHRKFENRRFQLNYIAEKEGSIETIFEFITNPSTVEILKYITGGIGLGVAGNFTYDFIKSIFSRSVGGVAADSIENLEAEGRLDSGDLQALVEAIEPSIKNAHRSIGYGADRILIINGDNNTVTFNGRTKEYINSSREDDTNIDRNLSIGSFNANSGIGRAFDFEEGRTIPFELIDEDRETNLYILQSFDSYAKRKRLGQELSSQIGVRYKRILSPDGRTKKILISRARRDIQDL